MHSPPVGVNRYLNICWCFLRVVFGWTAKDRPVLRQTVDLGIDRARIVVLVRHVDLALRSEDIVLAPQIELFDLQFGRSQIQLRAQLVDCGFKKGQRCAVECKMSADFAIACVHRSLNRDFSRKIAGVCTKECDEIAELVDRCRDIPTKIGTEPVGRIGWERGFAAQSELVCFLFDVELLKLDLAIVKRSAKHDRFGRAIAPTEPGQFRPERCSCTRRVARVSTESKIEGVKQTVDSIGESDRLRRLCERNVTS